MTLKFIRRQLEIRQRNIGKERDKLRDLISDYEELADDCDTALEHLEQAVECLSQTV